MMLLASTADAVTAAWPALGAVLARPDVQQHIARRRWEYVNERAAMAARSHVVVELGHLQRAAVRGRALDHLADDLADLAEQLRARRFAAVHLDAATPHDVHHGDHPYREAVPA